MKRKREKENKLKQLLLSCCWLWSMAVGPSSAGSGWSAGHLASGLPCRACPCLWTLAASGTGRWDPRFCSGCCSPGGVCVSCPSWISRSAWWARCRWCRPSPRPGAPGAGAGSPWPPAPPGVGACCRSHRWLCQLFGVKRGGKKRISWTQEKWWTVYSRSYTVPSADQDIYRYISKGNPHHLLALIFALEQSFGCRCARLSYMQTKPCYPWRKDCPCPKSLRLCWHFHYEEKSYESHHCSCHIAQEIQEVYRSTQVFLGILQHLGLHCCVRAHPFKCKVTHGCLTQPAVRSACICWGGPIFAQ